MTGFEARATTHVDATPDQVWAGLTDPYVVKQYMFGATVETDWKVGSPITWSGEWDGKPFVDKGEIVALDEPYRFEVTHFSPLTGEEDTPDNYHRIVYALTPSGEGTDVVLTQDGCRDQKQADQFSENWQQSLDALKRAVEGA